jgi:hypothetical protein
MKEGLLELLARKTEEGRRNAGEAIEHWQTAVEAANCAAKIAEYEFIIPSSLTNPISGLAEEVVAACYVSAVGIRSKAMSARYNLMRIATEGLEEELRSRGEDQEAACRAQANLRSAYEDRKRKAEYVPPKLPAKPSFRDGAAAGLGLGCLSNIVLVLIALIVPAVDRIGPDSPLGATLTLGPLLGGWLIVPIWRSLSHSAACQRLEADSRAKAVRLLANVEEDYKKQSPSCESAVELANLQVQKVKSALQWLREQWKI